MIIGIRAELLKLRTGRMLPALLALTVGMTVFIAAVLASRAGQAGSIVPSLSTSDGILAIATNTGFGRLIAAVLGIVVAAGEFRSSAVTETYLDEPRRARVLVAKTVAGAIGGAVIGAVAALAATGAALAATVAKGYEVTLSAGTALSYGGGAILSAALLAALGVGIGTLVRNQIGAIIGVFGWALAVEQLLGGLSSKISPYLPITLASTIGGATTRAAMPPIPANNLDPLPVPIAAAVLAALVVLVAAIAARTSLQRDIT